jgi:predicted phage baseplate assembly protein
VRFVPPADWQPEGPSQGGLTPYALIVRTEHASFTYPPRVARIVPNAIDATHRRAAHHAIHASWLPLPGNLITLPEAESPPIGETIEVSIDEIAAGWQTWRATPSLAFHGPADRVFEVDREAGRLRFGDGLTGRVPRPQEATIPNVSIDYVLGAGARGNLGAGLGWVHEATGLSVANIVDVSGGAEPETPRAAADRVASALRRATRAVVAADYEELALTTPGLAIRRAHAAVGYSSLSPCIPVPGLVTVFVVPFAPREEANELIEDAFVPTPQPDPGALLEMRARLDNARLVTHEVCVRGPLYRAARVRIEIIADTGEPAELRRLVATHVARYLDPLVGGDDGAGWPFGEPLRQSAILRVAQEAIRTDGTIVRVAIALDACTPDESCHEVPIGDHALVGPATIDVHVRPQPPAKGALR